MELFLGPLPAIVAATTGIFILRYATHLVAIGAHWNLERKRLAIVRETLARVTEPAMLGIDLHQLLKPIAAPVAPEPPKFLPKARKALAGSSAAAAN